MARDLQLDVTDEPEGQQKMDLLVGYLLLAGVPMSIGLIAVGLIWRLILSGHFYLDHKLSTMNLFEFLVLEIRTSVSGQLRPRTLGAGIAVLMLTPYLRVLASMFYFMIALRNWKYTLFTGIVLGVLTVSLFLR